jgi:hypothetical protein
MKVKWWILLQGHDTTAAGSSFFLCLMGIHQNYQVTEKKTSGIYSSFLKGYYIIPIVRMIFQYI